LIEIHYFHNNNNNNNNHYKGIVAFLKAYNFKIELEKIYENGMQERHMIVRKIKSIPRH
jgi:hypothetical protein